MTVKDLREALTAYADDLPVYIKASDLNGRDFPQTPFLLIGYTVDGAFNTKEWAKPNGDGCGKACLALC